MRRHWKRIAGGLLLAWSVASHVWHPIATVLEWTEHYLLVFEFWPMIREALGFLANPPAFFTLPLIGIGLLLIYLDSSGWIYRATRGWWTAHVSSPEASAPPDLLSAADATEVQPGKIKTTASGSPEERRFSNRTAHELLGYYRGDLTPLQADRITQSHKGLWIKVEGVAGEIFDGGAHVGR